MERETVEVYTFIGRMVQHTFPKGFQRIRSYGVQATKTFVKIKAMIHDALAKVKGIIGAFGDSYASRRRRRYRSNTRSNVPLYLAQRSANISLLLASYHQAPERLRRT